MREHETPDAIKSNPWWDPERQKVYAAESAHRRIYGDHGFGDLKEARRWVREMQKCRWWSEVFPGAPYIGVRRESLNPYAAWACQRGDSFFVSYPDIEFRVDRSVLLHEIAHLLNKALGIDDCHGPHYRRWHVELLKHALSPLAGREMLSAYRRRGLVVPQPSRVLKEVA